MDDRGQRPGSKFADADLIGIPHRLVIGERGLDRGEIEYKSRREDAIEMVALDSAGRVPGDKTGLTGIPALNRLALTLSPH